MITPGHRRLILIRHAKSAWDDPLLSDRSRPLNARGRSDAARIGRWLAENRHLPDAALVSPATRTCETWELIAENLPQPPEMRVADALYHAGPDTMLRVLQQAEGGTVLMLGHNPGIAQFARMLLREPVQHAGFDRYPTCATLVAEFAVKAWAGLAPATGKAVDFVVPRDLN